MQVGYCIREKKIIDGASIFHQKQKKKKNSMLGIKNLTQSLFGKALSLFIPQVKGPGHVGRVLEKAKFRYQKVTEPTLNKLL